MEKLPLVELKGEIRKMLGIFNTCRNVFSGLATMVRPLYVELNARELPNSKKVHMWVQEVWDYILANNLQLSLKSMPPIISWWTRAHKDMAIFHM